MQRTLTNLWPDIRVDVVSPLAILRAQAEYLTVSTKGLLRAEVVTDQDRRQNRMYYLDVVAPVLQGRRLRLLGTSHPPGQMYPTNVGMASVPAYKWTVCADQSEFERALAACLGSSAVRGIVSTLLAETNETPSPYTEQVTPHSEDAVPDPSDEDQPEADPPENVMNSDQACDIDSSG
jgi:hypothetical protein